MPATTAGLHPVIAGVFAAHLGRCMCGATDCPSCGPAQGYEVVRAWVNGRWTWVNPEPADEGGEEAAE